MPKSSQPDQPHEPISPSEAQRTEALANEARRVLEETYLQLAAMSARERVRLAEQAAREALGELFEVSSPASLVVKGETTAGRLQTSPIEQAEEYEAAGGAPGGVFFDPELIVISSIAVIVLAVSIPAALSLREYRSILVILAVPVFVLAICYFVFALATRLARRNMFKAARQLKSLSVHKQDGH